MTVWDELAIVSEFGVGVSHDLGDGVGDFA